MKPRIRYEDSAQEYTTKGKKKKSILVTASLNHSAMAFASDMGKIQCMYLLLLLSRNHYHSFSLPTEFRSPTFFPKSKIKFLIGLKITPANLVF